ncbi:MAG: NUDIX domain-containing protein [Bacteriovorax sp.]|nr:NUDIX domain-containing protein [Bacteriovorax sp.]
MTKKNIIVSIALFLKEITADGFRVWVQVRLEQGPLFGLLEFPGGKIEDGEIPETAARREVLEEVGIIIPELSPVVLFKYQDYSTDLKNLCLFVFLSNFDQLPPEKGQWLSITYDQKSAPFQGKIPPINHVILDDLAVYIQSQHNAGMIGSIWQM